MYSNNTKWWPGQIKIKLTHKDISISIWINPDLKLQIKNRADTIPYVRLRMYAFERHLCIKVARIKSNWTGLVCIVVHMRTEIGFSIPLFYYVCSSCCSTCFILFKEFVWLLQFIVMMKLNVKHEKTFERECRWLLLIGFFLVDWVLWLWTKVRCTQNK